MEFRQYLFGSDDYLQSLQLRHKILREPLGLDLFEEDLDQETNQLHFGLFLENKILASVSAVPLTDKDVKIRQMAVNSDHQGKGLGHRLFSETLSILKDQGFKNFELSARTTALGFYEKFGFKTVGDEMMEVTVPHFKMVKTLENIQ